MANAISADEVRRKIDESRSRFLQEGVDPHGLPYIRDVVADSWVRSKAMGLDPNGQLGQVRYTGKSFDLIRQNNASLLETAAPYLRRLAEIVEGSEYMIGLYTPEGVLLDLLCSKGMLQIAASMGVFVGGVFSEDTVGTCANGLCALLGEAIWVRGAEHYAAKLRRTSCAAAPIFSRDRTLVGVVSMESVLTERQYGMTLGWVSAFAWAIGNHMGLHASLDSLSERAALESQALANLCGACLAVDRHGLILFANEDAKSLVGQPWEGLENRYLDEILGDNGNIVGEMLSKQGRRSFRTNSISGLPGDFEVTVVRPNAERGAFAFIGISRKGTSDPKHRVRTDFISGKSLAAPLEQARAAFISRRNIVFEGEAGTGKSSIARLVCGSGEAPFAEVSCKGAHVHELELDLRGSEESPSRMHGGQRAGALQRANGGYLLISDIDKMPLPTQRTLVSAIKEGYGGRIEGIDRYEAKLNIVATTSENLQDLANRGFFDEGLLGILREGESVTIPSLRKRGRELGRLAKRFTEECAHLMGTPNLVISSEAMTAIENHNWPGNISQLRSCISYAASLADNGVIQAEHLPEQIQATKTSVEKTAAAKPMTLAELERAAIESSLKRSKSLNEAAASLGISRTTLYRKIRSYDLAESSPGRTQYSRSGTSTHTAATTATPAAITAAR